MIKLALATAFLAVFGLGGLYFIIRVIDKYFNKKKSENLKNNNSNETQTENK